MKKEVAMILLSVVWSLYAMDDKNTAQEKRGLPNTKVRAHSMGVSNKKGITTFQEQVEEEKRQTSCANVAANLNNKKKLWTLLGAKQKTTFGVAALLLAGGIYASNEHIKKRHAQGKSTIFDYIWHKSKEWVAACRQRFYA